MRLIKAVAAIAMVLLLISSPIIYSQYDLEKQGATGYVEIFVKHPESVEVYLFLFIYTLIIHRTASHPYRAARGACYI